MANKIVLKKSSVASKVPVAGDLDFGELAINYTDGKLYFKKADNSIASFVASTSGGTGGISFTTSETAPLSPQAGDQWLDSTTGIKYTYVDDDNSSQWVELEASVSVSQGSTTPSIYSNEYVLTGTTTNNSETEIFINGVSNSRITVPLNKTVYYTADIVCRRTDASGDHAAFYIKGVATNNAGTVSDVGLIYEVGITKTDPAFAVDFRADNTNDSVNLYVIGNTGKTLQWKCAVTALEV